MNAGYSILINPNRVTICLKMLIYRTFSRYTRKERSFLRTLVSSANKSNLLEPADQNSVESAFTKLFFGKTFTYTVCLGVCYQFPYFSSAYLDLVSTFIAGTCSYKALDYFMWTKTYNNLAEIAIKYKLVNKIDLFKINELQKDILKNRLKNLELEEDEEEKDLEKDKMKKDDGSLNSDKGGKDESLQDKKN